MHRADRQQVTTDGKIRLICCRLLHARNIRVCRTKKSHKPSYGRIALQEGDFFIALAKKKATMPLLFLSFTTFVG
jgi:hypothetical protein